jgi:hypothetical protein
MPGVSAIWDDIFCALRRRPDELFREYPRLLGSGKGGIAEFRAFPPAIQAGGSRGKTVISTAMLRTSTENNKILFANGVAMV